MINASEHQEYDQRRTKYAILNKEREGMFIKNKNDTQSLITNNKKLFGAQRHQYIPNITHTFKKSKTHEVIFFRT